MKKLVAMTSDGFTRLSIIKSNYLQRLRNSNYRIILYLFILLILLTAILYSFYSDNFFYPKSANRQIHFYLILLCIFIFSFLISAYKLSKENIKSRHYEFHFNKINLKKVDYHEIKIDQEEIEDFKLLISGYKVSQKINFKLKAIRNKKASYRMLFCLFHCLIRNGIQGFEGKKKDRFFSMLNESFLMDQKPLNFGTFKSSFSDWKNKMNRNEYSQFILFFKQALKIK